MAHDPIPSSTGDHAEAIREERIAHAEQLRALSREERRIHARLSRRAFLGTSAAGTFAALAGSEPALVHAQGTQPRRRATADAVIVLWMAGGMAQTETFDPKRYTPYSAGVPLSDVLSTFPTIDTAVDHIKFTQGLEQIASVIGGLASFTYGGPSWLGWTLLMFGAAASVLGLVPDQLITIFKIPELRKKIFITLIFLAVYRIGYYVPLPMIDQVKMAEKMQQAQSGALVRYSGSCRCSPAW